MKLTFSVLIGICLIVSGCATIKMSEKDTVIVLAKEVDKEKGPSNISDVFTYEGNIYVYTTFRWNDQNTPAGSYNVEAKWFNGDKRISSSELRTYFNRTPHYVWFKTRGTAMGTGKCRVEVYANDIFVGSKSFTVVEK